MKRQNNKTQNPWLALMIGNSRLHWAKFNGAKFVEAWDIENFGAGDRRLASGEWKKLPLYIASVVPSEMVFWQNLPNVKIINRDQIPLKGMYSSLGIDRALAVLGAGVTSGWPILVIDGGTALTLTGADEQHQLIGGAIFPGLKLQIKSLAQGTAALPEIPLPSQLPPRWALDTKSAIQSGIVYTALAGIVNYMQAWWREFPKGQVVLTGGDRTILFSYLEYLFPDIAKKVKVDPYLIFWGMRDLVINH
ncbi:pantothenate kinase [[Phormidium] sp. LEGE 05292]|uniref:pantothenate kinase n=1 Tax=[Phormidium] sp. LEGE 05292 TaxID=767427 RepID=UPI002AD2CCBC|nr:pantothenate kinase [Phormidium sp. LEGE 05292]